MLELKKVILDEAIFLKLTNQPPLYNKINSRKLSEEK